MSIESARLHAGAGRLREAEVVYLGVLDKNPGDLEALNFVAMAALQRGDLKAGIEFLQRAVAASPEDPLSLKNIGCAYLVSGQLDEALAALRRSVKAKPDYFQARLHLGQVYERLQRPRQALMAYFSALTQAQSVGQWLDDRSTHPGMQAAVKHATRIVVQGRRQWMAELLEPLRARYGRDALKRVEHSMAVYLGDAPLQVPDARQMPRFLYFPGLPTHPYFNREQFDWIEALEARTTAIREELLAVLAESNSIEPFNRYSSPEEAQRYLAALSGTPKWDAFFFYRHGERYAKSHALCPQTSEALTHVPLTQIRDHAPETCFSILAPGTKILPHRGVTNTRLVSHLPLVIPEDCALKVGGEVHVWEEGRVVVFDDTFEHEAWNHSGRTRAVMIMDVWNPYLTAEERGAIADLVASIGDFNREMEKAV